MSQINQNTTLLQELLDAVNNLPDGEFSKFSIMVEGSRSFSISASDFGSITGIRNSAFQSCANLTGIEIPEGVRIIGSDAFGHCNRLTSVIIPSSVELIGAHSFYGTSIEYFEIRATTPPNIGRIFDTDETSWVPQIIVPSGCGNAYKTHEGWAQYADFIVEATE